MLSGSLEMAEDMEKTQKAPCAQWRGGERVTEAEGLGCHTRDFLVRGKMALGLTA